MSLDSVELKSILFCSIYEANNELFQFYAFSIGKFFICKRFIILVSECLLP